MMIEEIIVSPPAGSLDELSPDDLILVTPAGLMSYAAPNENRILVFDLGMLDMRAVLDWLAKLKDSNATIIVMGTAEQLPAAQARLAKFDISFVEKPAGLPEHQILQFLYNQLGSVYAPFRREGVQFAPHTPANAGSPAAASADKQQRLLTAVFGEHADTVAPLVDRIDPAYSRPMVLSGDEYERFLARLRRPETEEPDDSE